MDHVDEILAQWRKERPDLDVTPMGLVGRMMRAARHMSREMEQTFAGYGLNGATFDVLATLRRSGAPYALSPGDLMDAMMVTSGTVTNRIDQLEKAGLVKRRRKSEDKRGFEVGLTEKGLDLIERAVSAHVATQTLLVEGLPPEMRRRLDDILRHYIKATTSSGGSQGTAALNGERR